MVMLIKGNLTNLKKSIQEKNENRNKKKLH